ncbi:sugar O-acetyltransferase [Chondrinema litorale]|uniref:sugar O-acetyltransferase n=1 Tax=Chondrinema litorale TaxID=2994555 RepID=UPI00254393A0|nr:sugar O-acetyltransferase [Chondrinema litorale]UZR96824.1 sugar O-acetyltransferase [Chondrinema litorale]
MEHTSENNDIIYRLKTGETIPMDHPDFGKLADAASNIFNQLSRFNNTHNIDQLRSVFSVIIGEALDATSTVYPPFYTNYGKNISIGKNVFINHAASFLDLGGIIIEDNVMIGPRVNISSENHPVDPANRKQLIPGKVTIKKNAWLGAGVTVLPGVTIGENSVVAAGAVVTQDVPDNVLVGGVPAKILKKLN